MSSILVLCSEDPNINLSQYDGIIALSRRAFLMAQRSNLPSVALFDLPYLINRKKDLGDAAEGVLEYSKQPGYQWSNLAFRGIYQGLSFYRQYKARLRLAISTLGIAPTHVTLSSDKDDYLTFSLENLSQEYNFKLTVSNEKFDWYSSLDPFMSANDLKNFRFLDPYLVFSLIRQKLNPKRARGFYQPYWNLKLQSRTAVKVGQFFILNKIFGMILGERRNEETQRNFKIKRLPRFPFNSPSLKPDEFLIFESLVDRFFSENSNRFLNKLHRRIKTFFSAAAVNKDLCVLDPYLPFSQLLISSFKESGGRVSFLPHGLTIEKNYIKAKIFESPDLIHAWNEHSKIAFENQGFQADFVQHQLFNNEPKVLRRAENWKSILVLTSSGDSYNPARLEQDLFDLADLLLKNSGLNVEWKLHDTSIETLAERQVLIEAIAKQLGVKFSLINSSTKLSEIVSNYDLVITCGLSTAIVESLMKGCPVIIYRLFEPDLLPKNDIPAAETAKDLAEFLSTGKEYPYEIAASHLKSFYNKRTLE